LKTHLTTALGIRQRATGSVGGGLFNLSALVVIKYLKAKAEVINTKKGLVNLFSKKEKNSLENFQNSQ
jgi:hypothetical protein